MAHSQHHHRGRETMSYRFISVTTLNSASKGVLSDKNVDDDEDGDDDDVNTDEDIYKDFMPEDYSTAEAKTSGVTT